LIVEDDGIFASVLKQKLQNWGYEAPKIALTGKEAVQQMRDMDPDLVIMDLMLKGKLNGIETSELIDSKHEKPIIYYSAESDTKLINNVKKLPNRDYIKKTDEDKYLKLSIEKNLEKKGSSIVDKFKAKKKNKEPSKLLTLQNSGVITGDEKMNDVKSTGQNKGEIILKKVQKIPKDDLNASYINSTTQSDNKTEIVVSSDNYNQTRQKIENELQNLETVFSNMSNKVASQETEIKKLKEREEKYILSLREKNKKIEEMSQNQRKLEEEMDKFKNQREEALTEMYNLKKEINRSISIMNG